jgi:heat shock transcription factor
MNSEPSAAVAPEPVSPKEQLAGTAPTVATGVNDVFWEQFLTENPGSTNAQEVQSERKDSDGRKGEIKPVDPGKFWWNMRNVNNLTEQMGHLTPAERT